MILDQAKHFTSLASNSTGKVLRGRLRHANARAVPVAFACVEFCLSKRPKIVLEILSAIFKFLFHSCRPKRSAIGCFVIDAT